MSAKTCNFQSVVAPSDKSAALLLSRCEVCSISAEELRLVGRSLEVCGVEHYSDLTSGDSVSVAIPLCPECHRRHHLDASLRHEPCHRAARRSWEKLV